MLEWHPEAQIQTPVVGPNRPPDPRSELHLVSWNIGYGGLGAEADFFLDGGKQVRPASRSIVERNLGGVLDFLKAHPVDLLMLQEVDKDAKRSHGIDQILAITEALPAYSHSFAANYRSPFVPAPLFDPLGRVHSGLLSMGRQHFTEALRLQLPGDYPWPTRVFHLKRCVHELRLPAPDGKDWVILHLHLSAFDKDGELRVQQMDFLKKRMLRLHAEGHHVLLLGDWNHAPPNFALDHYAHKAQRPTWFQQVPVGWTPHGWHWAYDNQVPSLRANNKPYSAGENFVTTVDTLLLSPDIELLELKCHDLGFTHSDHNPIEAKIKIKGSDTGT